MQTTGREYLRVSQDPSGRMESPGQQHEENERDAQANGWALGEPYREPEGVSASRFSVKAREEFDRLTGDLESGRFGAQILILWECSRGSRKLSECARLIEQCDEAGIKIYVTSHGRLYDPRNWRDRRTLQEDGVDSETESGKSSARVRRAAAANAVAGKPHGRTPYGYQREYAINGHGQRVLVRQFPEPTEAAVVVEIFRRLRKGHSLRAVERDFEARGIVSRNGKLFAATQLREMALRPVYLGLRVHEPGMRGRRYRGNLSDAVPATWPPLIDGETFHAVRALLLDPKRITGRPGRAVHLMSMIAVCGVCSSALSVSYRSGKRDYQCRGRACVKVNGDDLDAYAEQVMLGYLARPDVIEQLRARPEGGELAMIRAELAEARSELATLRSAGRSGKLSVATLLDVEPGWVSRVEALEARERELITPPALSVIPPGKDVARRWAAAPMSARRTVARLLCSPAVLGQLRVNRQPTPGRPAVPAEDRVSWKRD
jgi:site-specific DNA recombinase